MPSTGFKLFRAAVSETDANHEWADPANALIADDITWAESTLPETSGDVKALSEYLVLTNPDLSGVPAGAVNIKATVRIRRTASKGDINVYDDDVRLVVGGTKVGSNLAKETQWLSRDNFDYGTDWGVTLERSDLDSDFGVALRASQSTGTDSDAEVYTAWVNIDYESAIMGTADITLPGLQMKAHHRID